MTKKNLVPDLGTMNAVELSTAKFTKLKDGIIWIQFKNSEAEFDLPDAQAHSKTLERLSEGKPVHTILDVRCSDVTFTNEARSYCANDPDYSRLRLSQAIVIKSLAHNLVANFYVKFNKPTCPVSIFTDFDEAVDWVKSIPSHSRK